MNSKNKVISENTELSMPRRNILRAFAALGTVAATPFMANAASYNKGAGDFRKVLMRNDRTGEIIDMVYWVDGKYINESLNEISSFFRDWRTNQIKPIDRSEVDIISATHRMLDTSEPYLLISGYRSPKTNRQVGGASKSYHTRGMAADLRMGSRSVRQMSGAAQRLGAGGVGSYYGSSFVHMDSGPVRTWRG